MLRFVACVAGILLIQFSSPALADEQDRYFRQDLQNANADPRYDHLVMASEKVRVYRLHHYFPGNWDELDPTFDGKISGNTAAMVRASTASARPPRPSKRVQIAALGSADQISLASASSAPPKTAAPPSKTAGAGATSPGASPGQWFAYLRKDFTDIYSIIAPNSAPASTGATFSYTDDQVARNTLISGQGAIFGGYSYLAPQFNLHSQPYLLGFAAGPYYTFTEARNSNSADFSKNTDNQTYGGVAEIATGNLFGIDTLTEFTRVSVGNVEDNIKDTSHLSGTASFLPVYAPLLIHWPHAIPTSATSDFLFRFDPSFQVQYDTVEGNKQLLLFSNETKSLRVGPQASLWIVPFDSVPYLENIVGTITYHWAYETYSQRDLHWFETDLTYKINPNFGITATYQDGENENTGTKAKQYMVSLSSALDYCSPACPSGNSSGGSSQ